jgi:hypothetical protein
MNQVDYIINYFCSNKNKDKNDINSFISRIKVNSFFFQNELSIFNILETIKNSNDRYYIFETVEMIQYNELNKNQSSLEQSITIQNTSNYLVRYKNVEFLSLEDVLDYYSNNIQCIRFLVNSYKFLLNSIDLLVQSNLTCFYCKCFTLILYKNVRDGNQWSLDRIDNDKGHSHDNVVISCLKCNLQRKRRSSNTFAMSKQMVLTRV